LASEVGGMRRQLPEIGAGIILSEPAISPGPICTWIEHCLILCVVDNIVRFVGSRDMRDRQIRAALRQHLLSEHDQQDTIIVEELGLLNGVVRADVVLINGALNGYEIKSDRDTLKRLERQQKAYAQCFETMTLVVGPKHTAAAKAILPRCWGLIEVCGEAANVTLNVIRKAAANKKIDLVAVLRLLWVEELRGLLEAKGVSFARASTRASLIATVVSQFGTDELLQRVREKLKARGQWRSGLTPFRRGDSRQLSAKSPRSHKNRTWLLSQRSVDHPH